MFKWLSIFTALFLLCNQVYSSSLSAKVDRQTISIEETLTLSVRYDGQHQGGQPDFSQLEISFDILSLQPSNQFRSINGAVESFTLWEMIIAPKKIGKLLIPSFKYNNLFSDAIEIEVTAARTSPTQGGVSDLFVETILEQDSAYVQEQIILTYRLYTAINLESYESEALDIPDTRIEALPSSRYQRRIKNRMYGVLESRYALFPQTSGQLIIPSLNWTIKTAAQGRRRSLFDLGARYGELKRLRTEEKILRVQPKPDQYSATATWLPAKKLSLQQSWSQSPDNFRVGEPITRTISLSARGLTAAQLPPIIVGDEGKGYKLYADQPSLENTTDEKGVLGQRIESLAVVPTTAGKLALPPVSVVWWNTDTNQLEKATLPSQIVQVAAVAGDPSELTDTPPQMPSDAPLLNPTTNKQESTSSGWWPISTFVFAVLWLLFVGLWWQARRAPNSPSPETKDNHAKDNENQAFKQLQQSCSGTDLNAIRVSLLNWAKAYWPEESLTSTRQLSEKLNDPKAKELILALDASIFGGTINEAWNSDQLMTSLQTLRNKKGNKKTEQAVLKPLYPNSA